MATSKATGADLKNFFADPSVWNYKDQKDAYYLEDDLVTIDGQEYDSDAAYTAFGDALVNLPDDAKVTKIEGCLVWQGRGEEPSGVSTDLGRVFNKWVKAQQVRALVATIDIDVRTTTPEQFQELETALKALGARLSGVTVDALMPQEPEAAPAKKPRGPGLR
jgi:hypothetical protein